MVNTCSYKTFLGTSEQPPEYCENKVEGNKEFCELHYESEEDPDWLMDQLAEQEFLDLNIW